MSWWRRFAVGFVISYLIGALLLVLLVIVLILVGLIGPAHAHDRWANGVAVPKWVKSTCCGPSDVHHLNPSAVHIKPDGYHIDGLTTVVPFSRVLPSQDNDFWGFWSPNAEPDPLIFCFFAPLNGV